mgnify:FL=1|jgi:hypothetical protein
MAETKFKTESSVLFENCNEAVAFLNKEIREIKHWKVSACFGFMQGVRDVNVLYQDRKIEQIYCLPPNISVGELSRVFVHYLKANPNSFHEPAIFSMVKAFNDSFVCEAL